MRNIAYLKLKHRHNTYNEFYQLWQNIKESIIKNHAEGALSDLPEPEMNDREILYKITYFHISCRFKLAFKKELGIGILEFGFRKNDNDEITFKGSSKLFFDGYGNVRENIDDQYSNYTLTSWRDFQKLFFERMLKAQEDAENTELN